MITLDSGPLSSQLIGYDLSIYLKHRHINHQTISIYDEAEVNYR